MLKGVMWKNKTINPLNDLRVASLRCELQARGIPTHGKNRPELDKELTELQKGISNFPALLQPTPEATLESAHLSYYEVFGTEPLHDLKGHLAQIITEAASMATQETHDIIREVQQTVLNKNTLRCSDYRKATAVIYGKLQKCTSSHPIITELFRTATEISQLMYADDTKRTPKTVLRMHNTTLLHAIACLEFFSQPKHNHVLHTQYLHSIVCHAPLLLRIISLRSVNAEAHERMFGQMKQITKATSSYHIQTMSSETH